LYVIIPNSGAKMKKKEIKKLNLNKKKISRLNLESLKGIKGASLPFPSDCFCEKTICCSYGPAICSNVTLEKIMPEGGDIV